MTFEFEYSPAPEARSIVDIKASYGLFVDGEFVDGHGGSFKTISPSTEEVLAEVAEADEADVDTAVKAARRAYTRVWSKMSGAERGKYLFRIARILQERAREFAVLESIDNGKPIRESRDVDVPLAAAHFFYYAGWADKLEYAGLSTAEPGPPKPLGVAGQVIPWNFPLLMLAWKIAPALACGNTVVLKPAETTPLTALLFAEVCQQADLPPGVVNILTGAGETGRALVSHPDVDKVAFTGSTDVGRAIASAVAGTDKKVTLELGGKAANIVFDDAPVDQAVEGIVNGIFFNQGHVCCAGSRLLVQESVAEDVLDRLKRRMSTLRVGDPLDKNTDIGAINSAEQLAKIRELSEVGEAEGAGRWSAECELPSNGFWFPPTIFTGVTQAHRIAREEIFGPVLSVITFRTPKEAVEKANNTPYGLSAGVWSDKGSRILWMASQLRAGVVWSNTFNSSTRPARSAATRSPDTAARAAGTAWRPTCDEPATGRQEDLQALHRRRVPALGVGPLLRRQRRQGPVPRQRRTGFAQGRPRRREGRPIRLRRLVRPHGVQPRPGRLPDRRGARGPARPVRGRAAQRRRASPRRGRAPTSTRRSTAWSGTPAGPTRSPRSPAARTRSPGRTSTTPHPSRPASSRSSRRPGPCSAWSAWWLR